MSRTIYIDDTIDARPVSPFQWRVIAICFLLALVDGFDAQAIAFAAPLLKEEFDINPALMGRLFAAALVGLMIGAFSLSPLADRIGRKPVIVLSCSVMGVSALLTATAQSVTELFVYRFLTGIGLGGVMPTINVLTSEYAPARRRAFLMTLMFVGFPIGAVVGGIASVGLIEHFGWASVFILGGVAPLLLLALIVPFLPESIRFLAAKGDKNVLTEKYLKKIDPHFAPTESDRFGIRDPGGSKGIDGLFNDKKAFGTLLIWIVNFSNLLVMYALFSWLPSVMQQTGLALEKAIFATVTFNLGGVVGGLAIAQAIDRRGPAMVLTLVYAGAAFAIALTGVAASLLSLTLMLIFLAGAAVFGAQFGMNALVAEYYGTQLRTTGLGWALAVGRIGSIVGPVLVGVILARNWSLEIIFFIIAAPQLLSAAMIFIFGRIAPENKNIQSS